MTTAKKTWRHWRVVAATLAMAAWIAQRIKYIIITPPTEAEARAAEKARQKEIKRELRGLKDESR